MIAVRWWEIFYGDGSAVAWNCPHEGVIPGCDEHTKHVSSWAEAPPFGVFGIVYYRIDGTRHVQMEQRDNSQYRWPEFLPKPEGAVEVHGVEAAGGPVKFGLWVSNDEYFTLFDAAHGREVTP
jgi:hypothetical protein